MNVQSLIIAQGKAAFTPPSIAGLKVWLKADSLSLSDTDPIGTWADSSGNSNDGTAAGTARPLYRTGIINGLPVARFDGSNDVMTTPYTLPSAHTIFVCFNRSTFSPIGGVTGGTGPLWRSTTAWSNVSNGNMVMSATIYTGAFSYVSMTWNGNSTPGCWLNGVNKFSSKSGTTVASGSALQLGRSFDGFSSCDIAEVIVYDSVLGTTDRQSVEAYLAAKYAI